MSRRVELIKELNERLKGKTFMLGSEVEPTEESIVDFDTMTLLSLGFEHEEIEILLDNPEVMMFGPDPSGITIIKGMRPTMLPKWYKLMYEDSDICILTAKNGYYYVTKNRFGDTCCSITEKEFLEMVKNPNAKIAIIPRKKLMNSLYGMAVSREQKEDLDLESAELYTFLKDALYNIDSNVEYETVSQEFLEHDVRTSIYRRLDEKYNDVDDLGITPIVDRRSKTLGVMLELGDHKLTVAF